MMNYNILFLSLLYSINCLGLSPDKLIGSNLVKFNKQIYILGGSLPNDDPVSFSIWNSKDGLKWKEIDHSFPLNSFTWFTSFSLKERLYIVGGEYKGHPVKSIYSTSDFKKWKKHSNNFPVDIRFATSRKYNDTIYIIGGETNNHKKSRHIYKSNDGISWEIETSLPLAITQENHANVIIKEKIFFILGSNMKKNSSWIYDIKSKDWNKFETTNSPESRIRHAVFLLNNKIHLYGGESLNKNDSFSYNDLWSLEEMTWKKHFNFNLSKRLHTLVLELEDKVILIGGESIPLKMDSFHILINSDYTYKNRPLEFEHK